MIPNVGELRAAFATGPISAANEPLPTPAGMVPGPTSPSSGAPEKSEALYTPPAPSGVRKNCENCWKFVQEGEAGGRCMEMAAEEDVEPTGWCVMHSPGTPAETWPDTLPADRAPRTKEELAYINRPGGVACEVCVHYEPSGSVVGYCHALSFRGLSPAPVDALGSSARFRGTPEAIEDDGPPPEGEDDAEGR